jgi:hypothetical protein
VSRPAFVTIATSTQPVMLPWDSREELLAELNLTEAGQSIVEQFEAVEPTRPIELSPDEKWTLKALIDLWMDRVGAAEIPEGIITLWQALIPDLRDTSGL